MSQTNDKELKTYRVTMKAEIIYEVDVDAPDTDHAKCRADEVTFYHAGCKDFFMYRNPDPDEPLDYIRCEYVACWGIVEFDPKEWREIISVEELKNDDNEDGANDHP